MVWKLRQILRPKLDIPFESCKTNYRKFFYGNWFAIAKIGVYLRCEMVPTVKNQFRVPKVFGPLWGPQLKLQTRKVSHKFYKTVWFRFEILSVRIWNIFFNLHFKFVLSGLFTFWNTILSELFNLRQTVCRQFTRAALYIMTALNFISRYTFYRSFCQCFAHYHVISGFSFSSTNLCPDSLCVRSRHQSGDHYQQSGVRCANHFCVRPWHQSGDHYQQSRARCTDHVRVCPRHQSGNSHEQSGARSRCADHFCVRPRICLFLITFSEAQHSP